MSSDFTPNGRLLWRFSFVRDNFNNIMQILFKFGEFSPGKEIGIDFLTFVDFMRSNLKVMKLAIFFQYPCVSPQIGKDSFEI